MPGYTRLPLAILLSCGLAACASWNEEAGVENLWRSPGVPQWVAGRSTSEEVMEFLGPPSQIVHLQDQVVFYYLKEHVEGKGYYFLVYNTSEARTRYDRAIFFFGADGVLVRHAYSNETLDLDQ